MPYFDLHCHPGLKTLFQVQNGKQLSVWEDLSTGAMGKVLGSQSSFRQIVKDGKTNLVCLTLHPPEKGMTNQFVIFLAALTLAKNAIDYDRLVEISSTNCLYQTIFYQELANVMKTKGALKKVKFIKDWVEYNRTDFDTLHILFNIEGGHTFYDMGNKIGNFDQVLLNFKKFLDLKYRILYFTPTHLTPNEFITHAYGNKILSKGQLLPKGIGITPYGIQLIEYALNQKILIDVKHMSLVSRRIYYHWRKLKGETSPIIASHIGLAGNSWTSAFEPAPTHKFKSYGYKVHWQQNLEPKTGKSFYPLSINLYNEDIEEIVKSGGLIGISLDVRILGGSKAGLQKDFYSHEEFDLLTSGHLAAEAAIQSHAGALANGGMANGNFMLNMQNLEGEETEEIEDSVSEIRAVLNTTQPIKKLAHYQDHLNLVTSHIIRIFEICDWTNAGNPVKNICIGSDFDGLIEPLDCCQNASEFETFATALKSALKTRLTGLNIKNLPASEAESLIDRIMYGNAIEFMDRIWNKNQS